jgi:hypothetical protein
VQIYAGSYLCGTVASTAAGGTATFQCGGAETSEIKVQITSGDYLTICGFKAYGSAVSIPTDEPTNAPTDDPTNAPTDYPTNAPTEVLIDDLMPTAAPPTTQPTAVPTMGPTTIVDPVPLPLPEYSRVFRDSGNNVVCDEARRLGGNYGPHWGDLAACKSLCDSTVGCNFITFFWNNGCRMYTACDTTWFQNYAITSDIYEKDKTIASSAGDFQIGFEGQGPGKVAAMFHWNRALGTEELQDVMRNTIPEALSDVDYVFGSPGEQECEVPLKQVDCQRVAVK